MMMVLGARRASSGLARRERVLGERGTARKRTEAVVRRVVKGMRLGLLVLLLPLLPPRAEEEEEEVMVLVLLLLSSSFLREEMTTFMPRAVQRRAMCCPK